MSDSALASAVQSLCPNLELPSEAARSLGNLALDTILKVVKDAKSGALHGKRTVIETEDVNDALRLRGFEPVYGIERVRKREWLWCSGGRSAFFGWDKEILTSEVDSMSLPTAPVDATVSPHWLAIDGIQPDIPENRPVSKKKRKTDIMKGDGRARKRGNSRSVLSGMIDGNVELNLPVVHILSEEQQTCFRKVQNAVEASGTDVSSFENMQVLESMSQDAALQPLVPYLVRYITRQVKKHFLTDTLIIHRVLLLMGNLVQNSHLDLERYGHQILPTVSSCLLSSSLGVEEQGEATAGTKKDHWGLRKLAAVVLRVSVEVFGNSLNDLRGRISRELCECLKQDRPLVTQYGAIVGLHELKVCEVPSVSQLLSTVAGKLEKRLENLKDSTGQYHEVLQCQSALHDVVRSSASSESGLIAIEDIPSEPMIAGMEGQHIGHLVL
ncbi:hypothetical protein BSKO_05245 [Bryopsis sp. KO-2023]|nr:hypothetical protein BSKO_05245 [Bryopsis sp. KO-2023]